MNGVINIGARSVKFLVSLVLPAVMALHLGGCSSGPSYGRHEIEVCLSDQLKGKTVEVDLIPVMNEADLADWQMQNVTQYFSTGNSKRRETVGRQEFKFSSGDSGCKTVSARDPGWDAAWKGARSIVILANIPFLEGQGGVPGDTRRKDVTMQKGSWEGDRVQVQIGESGVRILTPQKQPKS